MILKPTIDRVTSQAIRIETSDRTGSLLSVRALTSMVLTLLLLMAVGYVGQSLTRAASFPIKKVTVEGDFRYLTTEYIQTMVGRSLRGGFFQIDVQEIRRGLLEEPWVMEATIERKWPDALRVAIREQQPAAQWGQHALLNTVADIFAPLSGTFPRDLPHLNGPVGSETEVLKTYRVIAERMEPLGLSVACLELSERGAWTAGFKDQTRLTLGRHRIEERLQRFRRSFESALEANWSNIESIDLRYTNGFAVQARKIEDADDGLERLRVPFN